MERKKINITTKHSRKVAGSYAISFYNLLLEKPFDEVSVQDICDLSGYKRSTFYNYFKDKYDLLDYCWYRLTEKISTKDFKGFSSDYVLERLFSRMYTLCERYEDNLKKIFTNNMPESYFIASFRIYMTIKIKTILENTIKDSPQMIPDDLLAEYYCSTIILIFEWRFIRDRLKNKEQAQNMLAYFVKNVSNVFNS